jgi:hypothetical protein
MHYNSIGQDHKNEKEEEKKWREKEKKIGQKFTVKREQRMWPNVCIEEYTIE